MGQYRHYKKTDDPLKREILHTILSGFDRLCPVQNLSSFLRLSKNVEIEIYKSTNLPVVCCVCETWCDIKEEHMLKVFQNRLLRRIFGSKKSEIIGGWKKLHNEELYSLYSPPSIIRIMKSRL
jgi:hypothetical protein